MVNIQGLVGPGSATTGSSPVARQDMYADLVVAQGRGVFAEAARQGQLFAACIPPGTGQAPGTAIGTTAHFTLYNPANSGKNLELLLITVGYISGTLGAGTLALLQHGAAPITAPSGGTTVTPSAMRVGSADTASAVVRFNNTVPASGIMIRAICSLTALLATTAVGLYPIQDRVDGAVMLVPGAAVSVQGIAAAGTSPLLTTGMVWAEVPV